MNTSNQANAGVFHRDEARWRRQV